MADVEQAEDCEAERRRPLQVVASSNASLQQLRMKEHVLDAAVALWAMTDTVLAVNAA